MNTKRYTMLLGMLLCAVSSVAYAQTITAPEPEFTYDIVYVLHGDSTVKLETQVPHSKARASASTYLIGIGSAHMSYEVNGSTSPMRIHQSGPLYFIARLDNNNVDPSGIIQVLKMDKTSKTRRCEIANVNALGTAKSGDLTYIPYEGKKYGTSSYLIKVADHLAPGEYAVNLNLKEAKAISLFGIDQ